MISYAVIRTVSAEIAYLIKLALANAAHVRNSNAFRRLLYLSSLFHSLRTIFLALEGEKLVA